MFSIYSAEKMKVLASNACISQIDHASVKFLSTCADIDRSSHFSDVAQLVERLICNERVGSSSLSIGANLFSFAYSLTGRVACLQQETKVRFLLRELFIADSPSW